MPQRGARSRHVYGLGLAISGLCIPTLAFSEGGVFVNPAFFYASRASEARWEWTSSLSESATTYLNATVGYGTTGGLLLGLKYIAHSEKLAFAESGYTAIESELTAVGATLGFRSAGFCVLLSAMAIAPPIKRLKTAQVTYSGGGGVNIDLLYLMDMGGWHLGPQLTWRSFDYKRMASNNPQADAGLIKASDTDIQPYIGLLFDF